MARRLLKHVAARVALRFLLQNNMLPKRKRVTTNTFKSILDKGSVVYGSFFIFRYIKQEKPGYAFVVSKKLAKTAVKRNSFRRKGYNIIRKYPIKSNIGAFFYKKEGLAASIGELEVDINEILTKTGAI